ncbi:hypothetical protein POM88_027950 [Heracleum sosnowskyi]|uniref:Uncharacterized protein n=1 Tax=Heracleum sosnowskyi TaxID=360622 RepID=A0AAD8I9Y5_9APIA|nr:hypothetical protein POM88_027950 [Heracleum sosnowskyi]
MANQLSCEDDGESGSEDDIPVLVLNGFVKGLFMVHQRVVFRGLPLLFFSNSPLPPEQQASQPVTHSRAFPFSAIFFLKDVVRKGDRDLKTIALITISIDVDYECPFSELYEMYIIFSSLKLEIVKLYNLSCNQFMIFWFATKNQVLLVLKDVVEGDVCPIGLLWIVFWLSRERLVVDSIFVE